MDFEKQKQIHRQLLLSSPINFASKMFAYINKRPFVIGKHHILISDALQKVVRGETQKLIINIAPRYGKAIDVNTPISTSEGWKKASQIIVGDYVYGSKGQLTKVLGVFPQGVTDAYRVTFKDGGSLVVSGDHLWAIKKPKDVSFNAVKTTKYIFWDMLFNNTKWSIPKFPNKNQQREITNIKRVSDRETVCFMVDAEDHLFCAGYDYVITHNTELISRMFIAYGFALNPSSKYLHISYSGNLVSDNSLAVKDIISSEYFQQCFDVQFKKAENTRAKWSTTAGGGEYATSTLGQITGFGAGQPDFTDEEIANLDEFTATFNPGLFSGAIVIDDPLRPDDALSDTVRENVNRRFETTIRNRVNSRKTPIIIVMQRLHEHDLCGYLQEIEPDEWKVLSIPAITTNEKGEEEALWTYKHTLEELYKIKHASDFVFETQYMQNPTPLEGLMYHEFKTYDILPNRKTAKFRGNYTDSADVGSDFLCSIDFDVHTEGYYIIDVIFTKKPMEYTEQAMAQMVSKDEVDICWVESNNGGRTFMRNVERISRSYENRKTRFIGFTQTKNKQVRIFTMSSEVNNMIIFPSNWEKRWPDFAQHIKSYRKEGVNAHDDGPDCLSGIIEKAGSWGAGASDEQILRDFL